MERESHKSLDLMELGKDTYNFHYNNLRCTKKVLKNYLSVIDSFTSSINDHQKSLEQIFKTIEKCNSIDIPFHFLKEFGILINFHYNYNKSFLETIKNTFDNLKKSINSVLKNLEEYLAFSQKLAINIKSTSENYFTKYDKLIESFEETENTIIEEYTKQKYKICLNIQKNKDKDKEKCIKETSILEREFLNLDEEIKEKVYNYIDEFNSNLKSIKPKLILLYNDTKNEIKKLLEEISKNNNNFNSLNYDSENVKNMNNNDNTFKKELGEYLNYKIKKDNNCPILKMINLEKYTAKIIKEETKNLIETDNYNAVPKNKKLTKTLNYSSKDIYKIVKEFYDCKFEYINKDSFNLDIEKKKLEVIRFMGKLLNYNFETHEKEEKKVTEKEKQALLNLIFGNEVYLMKFLVCLNNFRTTGFYEMSPETFDSFKLIFDKISDNLLVNKNKKVSDFLIILSQTFYVMKDEGKYYLQKEIKKKEFFKSTQFWKEYLQGLINEEMEKFEQDAKRNAIIYSEEKRIKKINDILFSKIASLVACLNGFELEKEKVDEILLPILDLYNLSDENKNAIISLVQIH